MTIDHISRGRFGLNLVMGRGRGKWTCSEGSQLEHDDRYAFGQEWLDLVRPTMDRAGLDRASTASSSRATTLEAYPKPYQAPRPVLINAGNSRAGVDFSARNVDFNFASLDTLENMAAYTKKSAARPATEYRPRDLHR